MTTNEDIVAALNGNPSRSAARTNDNVVEALRTGRRPDELSADERVLEALQGGSYTRAPEVGELPLQDRGDEMEAVRVWAAKEGTLTASADLAQALMRADPDKGIYAAEAEARAIADEAYSLAAESLVHEDDRHKRVQAHLTKMAKKLIRGRESVTPLPPVAPASPLAESVNGKQRRTSISGTTGQPINYYA